MMRTKTLLGLGLLAVVACGAGASTIVTAYPPSPSALDQLDGAAQKAGCTTEKTSVSGNPAIRASCKEGAVTFFEEKGTLRVDMGDKMIAECGDTPRPACDVAANRILDIAQGKGAPAASSAAPPATASASATASGSASAAPTSTGPTPVTVPSLGGTASAAPSASAAPH